MFLITSDDRKCIILQPPLEVKKAFATFSLSRERGVVPLKTTSPPPSTPKFSYTTNLTRL